MVPSRMPGSERFHKNLLLSPADQGRHEKLARRAPGQAQGQEHRKIVFLDVKKVEGCKF